jgi:hypothetical protein
MTTMSFKKVILIALVVLIAHCDTGSSKIRIGHQVTDKIISMATQHVLESLHELPIPEVAYDLTPSTYLPTFYRIILKNSAFNKATFMKDQITINYNPLNSMIYLAIRDLEIGMHSEFIKKVFIFNEVNGKIDFSITFNIDIKLNLNVENKKIVLKYIDSSIENKYNRLNVEGDFFAHLFGEYINTRVVSWVLNFTTNKVIYFLSGAITQKANEAIQSKISLHPLFNANLEVRMDKVPTMTADFFEVDLILDIEKIRPQYLNFLETDDYNIVTDTTTDQIKLYLDTGLINTVAGLLYDREHKVSISDETLPKDLPFKMNTYYFSMLIPSLHEQYPNKDLVLYFSLESRPSVKLESETQTLGLGLNVYLEFALKSRPEEIILSISTHINAQLKLEKSEDKSHIHFKVVNVEFEDMVSVQEIDQSDLNELRDSFNSLLKSMDFFINNYVKAFGVPLPVIQGFDLKEADIAIEDEYLSIQITPSI